MEEIIKRLIEWSKGNPQGPISIHLDPTNRCNLKCRFCWQRSHERLGWIDRKNELSEKKLLSIVREAAMLGVKDWLISGGGEPLVRTGITIKIMKEIKKYGMVGDIITNGTLGTEKHFREIVKCGWDTFRVSINAPSAEEHDFIVNTKGAFKRAVKNIKKINELKEELRKDKPVIGFNTVIQSKNYFMFPEIVELLNELDGKILNTQTIILYSDKEKKWSLNEEQRKDSQKYIKKALKIANKHGIRTNLENYLEEEVMEDSTEMEKMEDLVFSELEKIEHKNEFVHTFCFEPFYLITIRANGIVGSCRLFGDHGDNIHNKTLKEIWFGEYFNHARKILMHGKPQDFCSKCGSNEFLENRRIRFELIERLK
ncbi:MAG: radical SAM protein [Candidatus Aenigmarchaeota archaeon]|nr:radical SAM protein [Candidatus Aenigmarchaeota archaeon]